MSVGLPLLGRELIEQSRRGRTYVLRTVYALVMFVVVFVQFEDILTRLEHDPFDVLGMGSRMFGWLIGCGMAGIYLVLPAILCRAIAGERERNTLSLLLVSRLSPGAILVEKLLGGLVPMFSLLLLCMPLAAFFYSLGGVSPSQLWGGLWLLFLACLQVGSFSLMISSRSRTTVSAMLRTYGWGALLAFAFGICVAGSLLSPGPSGIGEIELIIVLSFLFLLTTVFCWVIAKSELDKEFEGGAVSPMQVSLPHNPSPNAGLRHWDATIEERPVLWRLLHRRGRMLVMGSCPVVALGMFALATDPDSIASLYAFGWLIAISTNVALGASPMAADRSRQTVDVLLAAPIPGREIVSQQMNYVLRIAVFPAIPLLMVLACAWAWWDKPDHFSQYRNGVMVSVSPLPSLLCWTLAVIVYLPLAAWSSFLIGLSVRTQTRAIALALGLSCGSIVVAGMLSRLEPWWLIAPLLPALVLFRRAGDLTYSDVLLNFGYYFVVLLLLRDYGLRHADRLLGRGGEPEPAFAGIRSRLFPAGRMPGR